MPNTRLDSVYGPGSVEKCAKRANTPQKPLKMEHLETTYALNMDSTQLAKDWQEMFQTRKRIAKPGIMGGSLAKGPLNLSLSANDLTDRWIITFIIGEHRSRATLGENKKK